jgi:hypothetical protein
LFPLAHGLGGVFQAGRAVPPDLLKAVGLALYARGVRPRQVGVPFVSAVHATITTKTEPSSTSERPFGDKPS